MWRAKENDYRTYSVQQIVFHIERNAILGTAPPQMKLPHSSCSQALSRMQDQTQPSNASFTLQTISIKNLNIL
jgi:hypothetical protein